MGMFKFNYGDRRNKKPKLQANSEPTKVGQEKRSFLPSIFRYGKKKAEGDNSLSLNEISPTALKSDSINTSLNPDSSLENSETQNGGETKETKSLNDIQENNKETIYIGPFQKPSTNGGLISSEDKIVIPKIPESPEIKNKKSSKCQNLKAKSCYDLDCSYLSMDPKNPNRLSYLSDCNLNARSYPGSRYESPIVNSKESAYMFCSSEKSNHEDVRDESSEDQNPNGCPENSLSSCLKNFFRIEHFDNENKIMCENCTKIHKTKTFCDAKRKLSIMSLPKILIIQLKRFKQNSNRVIKIITYVHFDEIINLGEFCLNKFSSTMYSLFAVIQHSGNMDTGHYTAFVKFREPDDRWFYTNDHHIREVPLETVLNSKAYILMYRLIE